MNEDDENGEFDAEVEDGTLADQLNCLPTLMTMQQVGITKYLTKNMRD